MEKQLTMNLERVEAQEAEWLWCPYIFPLGQFIKKTHRTACGVFF